MAVKPTYDDLLQTISKLENSIEHLKKPERISTVLLSISKAVNSPGSLHDLFHNIHAILQRSVNVKNFAVALVDELNDKVTFPYFVDEKDSFYEIENINDPESESLLLTVIRSGKPSYVTEQDIEKHGLIVKGTPPKVWIGVPLKIKGRVIGAMSIQHYSDPAFHQTDDVNILTLVSDHVALAIERKMHVEDLRENEAKYRAILDNIIEGYYEVDHKGNMMFFNSAMCRILGYTEEELAGLNNRKFMAEESYKTVYSAFNHIYRTGEKSKAFECILKRKNCEEFFAEISVSLIRDLNMVPVGFRGLVRDISERKQAEDEKKRMEAQLQYANKMESIGTLAGGIAHNFNNLLMAIRGYAELMLMDTPSDHNHHKMLKNIEKQVDSGSRLTSQLVGYAREGKYEVRPVDLNRLVSETVDTFAMTRKEVRVSLDLEESLAGIIADQGQIEQVLMNLCINAADAMPTGGDLMFHTCEVSASDIGDGEYEAKPGRYVCLSVRDTGIGIAEDVLPHIFEPFFTTKDISSGTGLGLASTYGIVKAHGGYIDVESRVGKGTAFLIYLPVAKDKTEIREKVEPALLRGTETILFVDDDPVLMSLGSELLSSLGYRPVVAGGGVDAVRIYSEVPEDIDLVILDMIMPDMSGSDVYDRLKAIDSNVRVLLSSGYSIDGQAQRILDRGCNGFIQKPFDITSMSLKIRSILDNP